MDKTILYGHKEGQDEPRRPQKNRIGKWQWHGLVNQQCREWLYKKSRQPSKTLVNVIIVENYLKQHKFHIVKEYGGCKFHIIPILI